MAETYTRESTVSSVRFEDAQGGPFRILRMTNREMWVGDFGNVLPGTFLRAEGTVEEHRRFGAQFRVTALHEAILKTTDGAEAWLRYRLPHVGDKRAAAIIETHGDNLWTVLGQRPQVLADIPGISADMAAEIGEHYAMYAAEQATVTKLVNAHLKLGLAVRVYQHFGESTESVLATDPYEMMHVQGITFEIADTAAQSLGIERTDPRRAVARAWAKLMEAERSGECTVSSMALAGIVRQCMGPSCRFPDALKLLGDSKYIVARKSTCMLRKLDAAEAAVARSLLALKEEPSNALDALDVPLPAHLDPSQRDAVQGILRSRVAVLTGGPGTGKTTTLKALLDAYESAGLLVTLAAPTGKAAKRMTQVTEREAQTIHRTLGYNPDSGGWAHTETEPLEADVIVVDETSMVDIDLMEALLAAVGRSNLLFVGDVDQLPPVGPGQPFENIIRSGVVPVFKLTQVHRQGADSWVIDNAPRIIAGQKPSLEEVEDQFAFRECPSVQDIIFMVKGLYRKFPEMQVLTPEHRNGAGTVRLNLEMQKELNPESEKRFTDFIQTDAYRIYKGDKVLFTRNVRDLGLVNGDMGHVLQVRITGSMKTALVAFEGFEQPVWIEGAHLHYLTLAYAMTVHKSQGSEWDCVCVIADKAHRSLKRELLYTAVTRTSNVLAVLGHEAAIEAAVGKPRSTNRGTLLVERLQGIELK